MIDWQTIITTLGGTSILVAALAWLTKSIISSTLSKDLEKFKASLKSKGDLAIEQFKSEIQLESQKKIIEYSALHEKRAELIAELYSRLFHINNSIQKVLIKFRHREIRVDVDKKSPLGKRKPWEMIPGLEILNEDEEATIKHLSNFISDFHEFYGKYKIYFNPDVCDLIERFSVLASYMAINYENVALKDENGNLCVNPKVKEVWDKAIKVIPVMLSTLEGEFRSILGIHSKQAL